MLPNILDIVPRRKKLTNEDEGTPQIQTLGGTEQVKLPTPVPVDQPLPEFQSRSMLGARDVYDADRTIPLSGGGMPKFGQPALGTYAEQPEPLSEAGGMAGIAPVMSTNVENGSHVNIDPLAPVNSATGPVNAAPTVQPSTAGERTAEPYTAPYINSVRPEDEKDPYIRQQRLRDEGASKNKWWKRMLQGALRGMAAGGSNGLAGALGGALTGAAIEGIFPSVNTKFKTQGYLDKTQAEMVQDQQSKATDLKNKYTQAQIDNMTEDNRRLEEARKDKATATASTAKQKARDAWFRSRKFFDPSKATEADRRALAEFDETPESIGKYDLTKSDTKEVAGKLFKLNPNTGSYEDTGISDPSKSVVEYTITDKATGVTHKYATTSERAAGLKTQLEAAGMQIEAAKERTVLNNRAQSELAAQKAQQDAAKIRLQTEMRKLVEEHKAALAMKKMDKAAEIKVRLAQLQDEYEKPVQFKATGEAIPNKP